MKRYLSISDVARITDKERSTVFRWVKAGKFGPVRKVGNEYQIPHERFDQWWAENVRTVGGEEGA